ncbi:MAG TPA: hypothetical protein PLU50_04720, partial [Pseudobdellovibrionaceae bacterium]|nr:hypothetical protein [Pseudobdellovibrionaceae bacterium]
FFVSCGTASMTGSLCPSGGVSTTVVGAGAVLVGAEDAGSDFDWEQPANPSNATDRTHKRSMGRPPWDRVSGTESLMSPFLQVAMISIQNYFLKKIIKANP